MRRISVKLSSIMLICSIMLTLVSCNIFGGGNGGNDDTPKYGKEYIYKSGDMGTDSTISLGRADVITDKHLSFSADVESFVGLRLGHGFDDYTGSYIEIDGDFVKFYQNLGNAERVEYEMHGISIKGNIKVTIDVDNRRFATVNIESEDRRFSYKTGAIWYGSNGDIFAESLGSVMKNAELTFTADGYANDIQFYGDSYLSQSSEGWLNLAFNEGYTKALFDGFGGRGSGGAYASLAENVKHSDPKIVVWMMGMNDGTDTDINTPSEAWAANRDKLIALSEEYGFEIVFTTIPTVPNINHEAKNKWIRESGYRYIDMAEALGADGTGEWSEGYLRSDNVHPTALGAASIFAKVKADLPELERVPVINGNENGGNTEDDNGAEDDEEADDGAPIITITPTVYGEEYKSTDARDMAADSKISLGKADVITHKSLIFSANITSFEGIRVGHGYNDYTSAYLEIDKTHITQYQSLKNADGAYHNKQRSFKHGLQIKGYVKLTVEVDTDRLAQITLESNGKSVTLKWNNWYGANGDIFAESLGSVLTDAQLAFTADGWNEKIQFYGDSYLGQSTDRWLYYAFRDGHTSALFDGYGGRGSGGAYASLVANLEKSRPEIVVWMMGMNDGSDTDINTPSAAWKNNRDKLIALSEEYGFEIVFTTIPTVPNINHEAKNKWIRESGYRYIDMAEGLGADGTGAWSAGCLHTDNVHPTSLGAEAIYLKVKEDLPEFVGEQTEE